MDFTDDLPELNGYEDFDDFEELNADSFSDQPYATSSADTQPRASIAAPTIEEYSNNANDQDEGSSFRDHDPQGMMTVDELQRFVGDIEQPEGLFASAETESRSILTAPKTTYSNPESPTFTNTYFNDGESLVEQGRSYSEPVQPEFSEINADVKEVTTNGYLADQPSSISTMSKANSAASKPMYPSPNRQQLSNLNRPLVPSPLSRHATPKVGNSSHVGHGNVPRVPQIAPGQSRANSIASGNVQHMSQAQKGQSTHGQLPSASRQRSQSGQNYFSVPEATQHLGSHDSRHNNLAPSVQGGDIAGGPSTLHWQGNNYNRNMESLYPDPQQVARQHWKLEQSSYVGPEQYANAVLGARNPRVLQQVDEPFNFAPVRPHAYSANELALLYSQQQHPNWSRSVVPSQTNGLYDGQRDHGATVISRTPLRQLPQFEELYATPNLETVSLQWATAEAAAQSNPREPLIRAGHDPTEPMTEEADRQIVIQLILAMNNMSEATDNQKARDMWVRLKTNVKAVELAAWSILEKCKVAHSQGNPLVAGAKPSRTYDTFFERVHDVCASLRQQKTMCKHLIAASYIDQMVDDPRGAAHRIVNNRKVNSGKKVAITIGKQAMERARSMVDEEGANPALDTNESNLRDALAKDGMKTSSTSKRARKPSNRKRKASTDDSADQEFKPSARPKRSKPSKSKYRLTEVNGQHQIMEEPTESPSAEPQSELPYAQDHFGIDSVDPSLGNRMFSRWQPSVHDAFSERWDYGAMDQDMSGYGGNVDETDATISDPFSPEPTHEHPPKATRTRR